MSIQTELTRITNAKTAIKTAIEGKGVTVPDGTLLDGMAALIESIQAGSYNGMKLEISTLIPSEKIYSENKLIVAHGLGVIPKLVAVMTTDTIDASSFGVCFSAIYLPNRYIADTSNTCCTASAYHTRSWNVTSRKANVKSPYFSGLVSNSPSPIDDATDSSVTLCGLANNTIAGLLAGKEYFLFIGG